MTHIVEIWKHSLSVSFFGEAVQIWSLCVFSGSFGLQSWSNAHYFTINVYFRKKSYLPSMKLVVRTWACAISLCHLHFRLLMFGSHSQNQHAFTVSFISRRKFIFLFFNKAVRILSVCEFSWSFGLQSGSIYINLLCQEEILSPIIKDSCWNLLLCYFSLTFWFQIAMFGSHIQNQDDFTVSSFLTQKFIFLFFQEAV